MYIEYQPDSNINYTIFNIDIYVYLEISTKICWMQIDTILSKLIITKKLVFKCCLLMEVSYGP